MDNISALATRKIIYIKSKEFATHFYYINGNENRERRTGRRQAKACRRQQTFICHAFLLFLRHRLPVYFFAIQLRQSRAGVYDLNSLEMEVENAYKISATEFATVLTGFYVSNILLCIIASWTADRYGRRYGTSIFSSKQTKTHRLILFALYTVNLAAFILNLISCYKLSYSCLFVSRLLSGLCVEAIVAIIDDVLTDYAGNRIAFALTVRNSLSNLGKVITFLACPAIYNIRYSLVDCGYYMLFFVTLGYLMCIGVILLDTKAPRKVVLQCSRAID
eukprot:TRINITY_DN620_c0_g1_i1.p1 TRINITY_DN620_c0_g1~~TRINITY_DN620_c0_g1_i1.p1  ORF type:complete len:287 (-),score=-7.53 TRINITY_DN620_c0_g1_i1:976-1806(-)